jgi:hypothetical protein
MRAASLSLYSYNLWPLQLFIVAARISTADFNGRQQNCGLYIFLAADLKGKAIVIWLLVSQTQLNLVKTYQQQKISAIWNFILFYCEFLKIFPYKTYIHYRPSFFKHFLIHSLPTPQNKIMILDFFFFHPTDQRALLRQNRCQMCMR